MVWTKKVEQDFLKKKRDREDAFRSTSQLRAVRNMLLIFEELALILSCIKKVIHKQTDEQIRLNSSEIRFAQINKLCEQRLPD